MTSFPFNTDHLEIFFISWCFYSPCSEAVFINLKKLTLYIPGDVHIIVPLNRIRCNKSISSSSVYLCPLNFLFA